MNGLLPALARRRFRLAGMEPTASSQLDVCRFFQLWRGGGSVWPVGTSFFRCGGGCRECVLFPVVEGGQTEWCICCSGQFPRSMRSRTQPGRAESPVAGFGVRIPSSVDGTCTGSRRENGCGRGGRMVRRETGIWWDGRAPGMGAVMAGGWWGSPPLAPP